MLLFRKKQYYQKRANKMRDTLKKWDIEKETLKQQEEINHEYQEIKQINAKKKMATSKVILFLFIGMCLFGMFLTGWATIQSVTMAAALGVMPDFAPIVAFIGSVVAPIIPIFRYYQKSENENTKGGIVYDSVISNNEDDSNGVG